MNLGDGSNGDLTGLYGEGVVIDDNGGAVFSSTGLTIALVNTGLSQIQSFDHPLLINATASATSSLLLQQMDNPALFYFWMAKWFRHFRCSVNCEPKHLNRSKSICGERILNRKLDNYRADSAVERWGGLAARLH